MLLKDDNSKVVLALGTSIIVFTCVIKLSPEAIERVINNALYYAICKID